MKILLDIAFFNSLIMCNIQLAYSQLLDICQIWAKFKQKKHFKMGKAQAGSNK
jgi:hypothetical protein